MVIWWEFTVRKFNTLKIKAQNNYIAKSNAPLTLGNVAAGNFGDVYDMLHLNLSRKKYQINAVEIWRLIKFLNNYKENIITILLVPI